jgi:hypothetical protein
MNLQEYYGKMSIKQLEKERADLQVEIEENDGRLSAHSSADLDYALDKIDAINNSLTNYEKDREDTLKKITDDLNERMKGYHSSLEPSNDEVTIAWLLMIIDELRSQKTNNAL